MSRNWPETWADNEASHVTFFFFFPIATSMATQIIVFWTFICSSFCEMLY